jgi:Zn-dependent alcohol dehydrogenase
VLPVDVPVVLGHEAAGTVEAVGSAVRGWTPGDRAVVSVVHHCGHCARCEAGYPPLCIHRNQVRKRYSQNGAVIEQAYGTGTFAERIAVGAASLVPVPDGVPFEVAAVTGCAVVTGMGAVLTIARVRPGSTVAVMGCGGVGMAAVMAARLAGAERVVAVDPNPQRRALALQLGADDAVAPDADALLALQPGGYDYAFESAGRVEAMSLAVAVTGAAGTTVLMGLPPPETELPVPVLGFLFAEKRLLACNMGRMRPNLDFDRYFRLYLRGRLPLDALVSAAVPLDDAAAAFARAERGEGIRTVLSMG